MRMTKKQYAKFLHSREWKLISSARKEMDGNKCTRCGATERLEAHHKTYDIDPVLGLLKLDNLTTLCRSCHDATHGYSYGRIDVDEFSYCRNCAWMNDNVGVLLCLRKESSMFAKEVERKGVCEWYWPWIDVPDKDRFGQWPASKVFRYISMNKEDDNDGDV